MTYTPLPRPTDAEIELLQVLWERGPSTVREIHETLCDSKSTVYTTTLKILQKMVEKGLVCRDESSRSHIYSAVMRAEQTQRQLVKDLLRRVFRNSPGKLVLQTLADESVSPAELSEIRELLKQMEQSAGKGDAPCTTTP